MMHLVNVLAQVRRGWQAAGPYVAYRLVHCLAIRSCSALLVMYCVAMLPTRGSAGKEAESGVSKYQHKSGKRRNVEGWALWAGGGTWVCVCGRSEWGRGEKLL